MENQSILIADDEKNIRLTLSQALELLGLPIKTAVNGEEALSKLKTEEYGLLLLDLKMPGMDGMEVLQRVREKWPKVRVIILTAHGTIEWAVEAMKLGAVDFIQKPFSPAEIREVVAQVLEREKLNEENATDYRMLIQICKRHITDGHFDRAREVVRKAIALDPGHPEAYNLLGVLIEIDGDYPEAQKFYRAAIDIDPTYRPAHANLERTTSWRTKFGKPDLGPNEKT
jgi:FixJ family two-component response regulator